MPKRAKTHVVYGLFGEGEDLPFYIGRACDPKNRMQCHDTPRVDEAHLAKSRKIQSLKDKGLSFFMRIAFTSRNFEAIKRMERDLIKLFGRRDIGTGILMNHTDGGDGTENIVWSDAARRRKSEAMMGSKLNLGRKRPDMVERESKPVSVYRRDGSLVARFASVTLAAEATGCRKQCAGKTARGILRATRSTTTGEVFQFRYEHRKRVASIKGWFQGDPVPQRVYVRSEEWRRNQSISLRAAAARRKDRLAAQVN